MKLVPLVELAIELGVNKSKLAYYSKCGLIKPVSIIGRMGIFDHDKTIQKIEAINVLRNGGKSLKEIKKLLK